MVAARPVGPPAPPAPAPPDRRAAVAGGVVLALLVLLAGGLVALAVLARNGDLPGTEIGPTAPPGGYAYAEPGEAPAIELVDQDGRPFSLSGLRGRPALVFFGYTHCPDVCPTTVGVINEALAAAGPGPSAVFVSIDPERDDVAAMKAYLRYLPAAYVGLSGTPEAIARAAGAWGVRYARVETGSAGGYAMAHTADLFLVDAQGLLRARFPFGTPSQPIASALRDLLRETPPPAEPPATPMTALTTPGAPTPIAPTPAATPLAAGPESPAAGDLRVTVVSSSVWSGGSSPVILAVSDAAGTRLDESVMVRARVTALDGSAAGPEVDAVAVRPWGEDASFVATLDIPTPGRWRLELVADTGGRAMAEVNALDPGETARLGEPAPDVDTPTLADVGDVALAITTQPQPDLRLSGRSTADARASGEPYVLVVDSARFQVTTACGRALAMIRYLLDRWTSGVAFIHLEPFEYTIVTSEPVLSGELSDPPLNRYARAFGLGRGPWPATEMPWVFVVDGSGTLRAKYTGVVGSADVDVMLSLFVDEAAAGS